MRRSLWLRWLLGIVLVGLLALTVFWFVVRDEFRKIVDDWRSDMEAMGYAIAAGPPSFRGWPLRLEAHYAAPAITAPGGQRWEGPAEVMGYAWLWDVETIVIEGPGRHRLEIEGGPLAIDVEDGSALTLGFGAGLDRVAVELGPSSVTNEKSGRSLSLERLAFDVASLASGKDGRRSDIGFTFELARVPLPPELASASQMVGPEIVLLKLDGRLQGVLSPKPWQEFLATWRDSAGVLDLSGIELDWGTLWVKGAGTLTVDQEYRPLGAFSFETLGLPELVHRATAAGLIDEDEGLALERGLTALASGTDEQGRHRVQLPITMQDGWLYIGSIQFGRLRPWVLGD
ncbi:MAG TPA: DUF2125 domain-containing protein [Kiloniellales bacterium]|nr:DUF2125 domain-containing protein [Kiloniellales bacterium]